MNIYLNKLAKEMFLIKSQKEMESFLASLFTPQELEAIPRRLEIIKRLKRGVPQHNIAKELGVGIATVTRGARELKMNKFKNV